MQSKLVNFQNTDLGDPFWKFNLVSLSKNLQEQRDHPK